MCPDIVTLFLAAAHTPSPHPALVPEVQATGEQVCYVLRCVDDHPEVCCRRRLLWRIVATATPNAVPILQLQHRNRWGRSGWHPHGCGPQSWRGLRGLLAAIRNHDRALYLPQPQEHPYVVA